MPNFKIDFRGLMSQGLKYFKKSSFHFESLNRRLFWKWDIKYDSVFVE